MRLTPVALTINKSSFPPSRRRLRCSGTHHLILQTESFSFFADEDLQVSSININKWHLDIAQDPQNPWATNAVSFFSDDATQQSYDLSGTPDEKSPRQKGEKGGSINGASPSF